MHEDGAHFHSPSAQVALFEHHGGLRTTLAAAAASLLPVLPLGVFEGDGICYDI